MAYDGQRVASIARRMLTDRGIEVREAARVVDIHRTVIYDIVRGDRVAKITLEKYADGLAAGEDERRELMLASGFTEPSQHVEEAVSLALRFSHDLSDQGKAQIMDFVRETKAKYGIPDPCANKEEPNR